MPDNQPSSPAGKAASPSTKLRAIIALIGIIIIVLALVSIFKKDDKDNSKTKPSSNSASAYTGEGFKITPPSGWQKSDQAGSGASVAFLAPKTVDANGKPFSPNINVGTESAQGLSLRDYVEQTIANEKKSIPGYKPISSVNVTAKGGAAYLIDFTDTASSLDLHQQQLVLIKSGKAYIATGTVPLKSWNDYAETVKTALLSLE